MTGWTFRSEGFDPDEEPLREALCTLGNGYMATRAAVPGTSADGVHYPGTYVAGVYNRLTSEVAGERIENESIVNVPDWLVLQFAIDDGPWIEVSEVELLDDEQEVDLRQGLLERHDRFRDDDGHTTKVVERRLVHMVLMLFDLFSADELREVFQGSGHELAPETIRRTVDYYLQRPPTVRPSAPWSTVGCSRGHGGTMGRVLHPGTEERCDRHPGRHPPEGIHLGAMAGSTSPTETIP